MTIFLYGCQTCGVAGTWVKRAQKYAVKNNIECEVRNSKYSEEDRIEHAINLRLAGLDADSYQPIVKVGDTVTRLRDFAK
jgi:hypothetical protein